MELFKLLSTSEIVAQILGFLILLFLLRIFAWKKILGLLDQRKEKMASELHDIEESKAGLEKLKSAYAAKLVAIEEEAKKRIEQALSESKLISEEARKKAHLQAQEIINNAKASIKYELAQAKEDLKEEVIEMTIKATENLLQEKITSNNDKRLVKEFLEGLEKIE